MTSAVDEGAGTLSAVAGWRTRTEEYLLRRWNEPHRTYHGLYHLNTGLDTLRRLDAGPVEELAWWFHDAHHTCTTPDDEHESARLAQELLTGHLPPAVIEDVKQLVLVTIDHNPDPGYVPAARISDADPAELALPWVLYQRNGMMIRTEQPARADATYTAGRVAFIEKFLAKDHIFHTPTGHQLWGQQTRRNLETELEAIMTGRTNCGVAQ